MELLNLFLFGVPRIEFRGKPLEIERRKALAIAAYLAVSEQPQSRDVVAALLWPDLDQEHSRAALRRTLPVLTGLLSQDTPSGEILIADRITISLNREVVWTDVRAFISLLAQSRSHDHAPDTLCDECIALFERAITIYRDDFMAGFTIAGSAEYDNWQLVQREWLHLEFAGVLKRLVRHYAERNDYEQTIQYARRWLMLDPLHEPAHRALMQSYAASGQRTEALRQYQTCVRLLDEELATPPEDETARLYEAIKSNTDATYQPGQGASPIIGVLPPLPPLIIGRDNALSDLKRRVGAADEIESQSLTVIQGWPGVGKSTLVAALAHDPEMAARFPDGILWTSLGESPELLSALLGWADALHLAKSDKAGKIEDITAQITAALREKRMLLIVDDVWHMEHAAPFRVGGQRCATIMTSRLNDVAQALAPTPHDVYRLPVLAEDAGLQLLQTLTPDTVATHPREARALVHDLEGLPLALQVAGRLLQNEVRLGWGVGELLAELREGARLMSAEAPGDMLGVGRDTTPTIAALLRRSTDALDPETCQRFADLALFVPKPATFGLGAMAVVWEVQDPKPTARILVNRGLLEPVSGGRFQIHAVLVMHARTLQEEGL